MKKDFVIGIGIGIPVIFLIMFIGGGEYSNSEFKKEYGKINMNPEITSCEILANQMIQAKNDMKQYIFDPNQFSSEESKEINNKFQNELNRITKEFRLKECDKNLDEWMTPEITQRVIDQTGG